MRRPVILVFASALPAVALAAAPTALAHLPPLLWEISGAPGTQGPVRQCVADIAALAQFEHRGQKCSRSVTSDSPSSTTIDYKCGNAGFGETQMDVLTPRSLRISTQGISAQLPFNYVLQAHRVGDCPAPPASPRH